VFEPSLGKVLDPISKTKPKGLGGVAPVTEHMSSNFEAQCRGKRESQSVCLYLSLSLSPAQAGLELNIIMPQVPKCWDYRCTLPCQDS
jgi:hypothetical protein